MKWTVQFRNRTRTPVTFGYRISHPIPQKQPAMTGSIVLEKGKSAERVVTLQTTDCQEAIVLRTTPPITARKRDSA